MPEIKFSCPHCEQHIAADSGYAGIQINCPGCNGAMVIPEPAAVTAAPAVVSSVAAGPRLKVQTPVPASDSVAESSPAAGCPSCGGALPRGAVLCTSCGYNLVTRKRIVAGQPAALGKPAAPDWETPWYKTAFPYVGAVFLVLGLLYFFGRDNPKTILALVGVGVLYTLSVHIMVLIAAFRFGVGTGFLTLCLPFYALYFVFKVHDNDTLKVLYGGAVLVNIALRVLDATMK